MELTQKTLVIDLNNEPENQRLLAGEPGTFGMRSGRVYLAPGKACGRHNTNDREELLVFLSGSGEVLIGEEERFQVGQGKVCYIPPKTPHDVKCTAGEPLVYVYCVAPVGESSR
jgi:mannose-6-phosphate isomerase-like protein (cupin superfamily)